MTDTTKAKIQSVDVNKAMFLAIKELMSEDRLLAERILERTKRKLKESGK